MGRKVTALRFDFAGRDPSVRALSKSTGGTTFTLRSVPLGKATLKGKHSKEAIGSAIEAVLRDPGVAF